MDGEDVYHPTFEKKKTGALPLAALSGSSSVSTEPCPVGGRTL